VNEQKRPPRPTVIVNRDPGLVIANARKALIERNVPPTTFIHGGVLVRVGQDDKQRPLIRALEQRGVRAMLAQEVEWVTETRRGDAAPTNPPSIVVDDLLSRADELIDMPGGKVPVLDRVVHAPHLRARRRAGHEAGLRALGAGLVRARGGHDASRGTREANQGAARRRPAAHH
jgi:hypothetical protein